MANHQISDNVVADFGLKMLIIAGLFLFVAPLAILRAWVLSWLWQWYVVPHFGVAPLPVAIAFGLALIASYIKASTSTVKKEYRETTLEWVSMFVNPLAALLIGWIGSFFV